MQPRYLTLTSTGSTPWQLAPWQATPQQISFAVISSGGSSYFISATLEDPSRVYPSPVSSTPTAFTLFTGSSNALFGLGSSATTPILSPIAGFQFTLNTQSSAGAPVTLIMLSAGIG
ncbi:hypothetical protein [Bradyrhizobium guangzhouense]|uniref:hypothetical protein n=1 Tax=Bradyrhizobium guangzhouense TaxID=1325095 RepID=UPI0010099068|nr:hypothetical protein [Bradyrhizobium guangzhouense]RXH15229.1 hypothetical protein EAS54_19325 [Bradyrhizobium guangzhouense]